MPNTGDSAPNMPRTSKPTTPTNQLRRVGSVAGRLPIIHADEGRQCPECGSMHPAASNFCSHDGTQLPPPGAPVDKRLGMIINDQITIVSVLGEGGIGTVYRATHTKLNRDVAVKLLHPQISADPVASVRFLREAQISSCMNHENVVDVFEYGKTNDGALYLVMDLLVGRTLAQLLENKRFVRAEDAVRIVAQVCDGLNHAHELGLVHRDLKPENIFILRADNPGQELVKILDFGLARDTANRERLTRAGILCGTPAYVSPEQAHGKPLDARSDVYALGIVLYELLTGEVPFDGDSSLEVLLAQANQDPRPMAEMNAEAFVPPNLEVVVRKALSKMPEGRFDNVVDMKNAMFGALFGDVNRNTMPAMRPVGKARIRRKSMDASRAETVLELNSEDFVNAVILQDTRPSVVAAKAKEIRDSAPAMQPVPKRRQPAPTPMANKTRPQPAFNRAETIVAPMSFANMVDPTAPTPLTKMKPNAAKLLPKKVPASTAEIRSRTPRFDTLPVQRATVDRAVKNAIKRRARMRRSRHMRWLIAAIVFGILTSAGLVFAFNGSDEIPDEPKLELRAPDAPTP